MVSENRAHKHSRNTIREYSFVIVFYSFIALIFLTYYEVHRPNHAQIFTILWTYTDPFAKVSLFLIKWVMLVSLALLGGGWIIAYPIGRGIYGLYGRIRTANLRCEHGVRGGETADRCSVCSAERKRLEEQQRRERAARERQQEIDIAHDKLRKTEIARLASVIVPTLEMLRRLPPYQFETIVASMFRRLGYAVEQTPKTNDRGRDGILRRDGAVTLFECKRYKEGGTSGRPDLQKFHSAIVTDGAAGGFFITTGALSREAIEFASKLRDRKITLVGPSELLRMLLESNTSDVGNQTYFTVCKLCGDAVEHDFGAPAPAICANRHRVDPSIDADDIERHLATPDRRAKRRRSGYGYRRPRARQRQVY